MARFDINEAISGAVPGAATGFQFGGVPGALVGGVAGAAYGLFKKNKKKKKKVSTLDKYQQALHEQDMEALQGRGPNAGMYNFDPQAAGNVFDQTVANPAYQKWQEDVIPAITGQYRSNNLMNSSYSGEALARSGRDVQRQLDAQRAKYMYQGQQDVYDRRQNATQNAINRHTFDYQDRTPNAVDQILEQLAAESGRYLSNRAYGV